MTDSKKELLTLLANAPRYLHGQIVAAWQSPNREETNELLRLLVDTPPERHTAVIAEWAIGNESR